MLLTVALVALVTFSPIVSALAVKPRATVCNGHAEVLTSNRASSV